jgi:hypothetical protein
MRRRATIPATRLEDVPDKHVDDHQHSRAARQADETQDEQTDDFAGCGGLRACPKMC